ncbi:MAG: AMP-binding protein [Dysgonamonadaceae bacterium]|jgi:long-chain acyl-CoA synthetase|nr:AMP-binding protein [Dysgonamonadaceae bacterium]
MIKENFIKLFEDGFKYNWDLPAMSNYGEAKTINYSDVAKEIAKLHIILEGAGIKEGDKIALIGGDTTNWAISYLASVTYGAVIVPILADFNPNDVQHIINHSESLLLFSSDRIWESLDEDKMKELKATISLTDFRVLHQKEKENIDQVIARIETKFKEKYPNGFTKDDIAYADVPNEKVVVLNYTSGTTGFSKGVMIMGNNLAGNLTFVTRQNILRRGEAILSFLPLAHTYGCAFEFLYSISIGCHVTFLGKTPSPKILMKAFEEVRPNIVITVPLILEKIYKKMILPLLAKRPMRLALSIPILDAQIYAKIRKKLMDAMGGNFEQVIIGGAPLNKEVEEFLYKIKFPFMVGYGMTECAPLISFDTYATFVPTSCGKILDIMEVRIDSEDPYNIAGEIQVRGENVMAGYYKNEEATKASFTEDGWLKTGDLGTIDKNDRIFIRGRSKSMILGASGQNIYPEEIESKLNNLPFVMESLIIERDRKLVALVYPDYDALDETGIESDKLSDLMNENKKTLNEMVAPYERIAEIQLYPMEFEKTPKKSIKRYLYQ